MIASFLYQIFFLVIDIRIENRSILYFRRGATWRLFSRKICWRTPFSDGEPSFSSRKYLASWRTFNNLRDLGIIFGELMMTLGETVMYLANSKKLRKSILDVLYSVYCNFYNKFSFIFWNVSLRKHSENVLLAAIKKF